MKLSREFYERPSLVLAPELVGKRLISVTPEGVTAGVIVETEAYAGVGDAAAHAYGGRRTKRTEILYGPGGYAYVYLIYGMYFCLNVVAALADTPECVLIRALEPVEGIPLMQQRRGKAALRALCSGPGKLCQALGISKRYNGMDLLGGELFLEPGGCPEVETSKRVNVDYAGPAADYPWRFTAKGNPFVSQGNR